MKIRMRMINIDWPLIRRRSDFVVFSEADTRVQQIDISLAKKAERKFLTCETQQ